MELKEGIIPGDDILDIYLAASDDVKGVVSSVLRGDSKSSVFATYFEGGPGEEPRINVNMKSDYISSCLMVSSIIGFEVRKFGGAWLESLLIQLSRMM